MRTFAVTVSKSNPRKHFSEQDQAEGFAGLWKTPVATLIHYKGYVIENEDEPWAIKYNMPIKFYNDEHIHHAESVEDAKEKIDERIYGSN